jgi:hypothetical protein
MAHTEKGVILYFKAMLSSICFLSLTWLSEEEGMLFPSARDTLNRTHASEKKSTLCFIHFNN